MLTSAKRARAGASGQAASSKSSSMGAEGRRDSERTAARQVRPRSSDAWSGPSSRRLASALVVLTAGHLAGALRFTSVQMPALVQRGANFWLSCQYELSVASLSQRRSGGAAGDAEQLYSVKWYRDNEEFYRLIFAGAHSQQQPPQPQRPPSGEQLGAPQVASAVHQQQYFSQAGVNVLMSASNATHVRLLNASLESDGSYACEISTQNLSTIRHEKEIKVYVLPHARLNLIGLRSFYALGERVELNCLSDFSRPAGALGWFISGQQIKPSASEPPTSPQRTAATAAAHFELAAGAPRPKPGEPKLSRSSATLKFKLSAELLAALGARPDGNQSGPASVPAERRARAGAPGPRLLELLKLECRYKLAEVTDVTFNELRVAQLDARGLARAGSGPGPSSGARRALATGRSRGRRRRTSGPPLALTKSHGTQVGQSQSPASRLALAASVAEAGAPRACQRGLLALAPEDPVILEPERREGGRAGDEDELGAEPELEGGPVEGELDLRDAPAADGALELPLGFSLSANCSTLGAFAFAFAAGPQRARRLPAASRQRARITTLMMMGADNERARDSTAAAAASDQDAERRAPSSVYCSDPGARRRLLVSGRSGGGGAPEEPLQPPQQQQQQQQQRRQHVAYVDVTSARRQRAERDRREPATAAAAADYDDKLSLHSAAAATATWSPGDTPNPALESLGGQGHASGGGGSAQLHHHQHEQAPDAHWADAQAPPLLEWFINNQEAPRASASYTPELPLLAAQPPGGGHWRASAERRPAQFDSRSEGGASGEVAAAAQTPTPPPLLPSIDYVEYFANFNKRPLDQHLLLQLHLEKRHFLTPDSLLRLRCTSTQAQVLATDSLTVSLVVLPPGALNLVQAPAQASPQPSGHEHEQRRHQQEGSHWSQRAPSGAQIKPKYLHQYPARAAGQRGRAGAGPVAKGAAGLAGPSDSSAASGGPLAVTALGRWRLALAGALLLFGWSQSRAPVIGYA